MLFKETLDIYYDFEIIKSKNFLSEYEFGEIIHYHGILIEDKYFDDKLSKFISSLLLKHAYGNSDKSKNILNIELEDLQND